jgi:hypothetical protein
MHGGLLAAYELNKGQTLFQDMCDRLQRGELPTPPNIARVEQIQATKKKN